MFDSLINAIGEWIDRFFIFSIVDAYERGVRLRCGKFNEVLAPGLHWRLPLVDRVLTDSVVQNTTSLKVQSLTTRDGVAVNVSVVVTHRIVDIKKALLRVEGVDSVLMDSCAGELSELVLRSTWDQVRHFRFARRVERRAKAIAGRFGMKIICVRMGDVSRSRSLRLWQEGG